MLVMTCIIFMMTYSSLLGTPSFSHKLSVFVDENNLSHEDIRDLIVKINQIESANNRRFTQELKKIEKRTERESRKDSTFLSSERKWDNDFYDNSIELSINTGNNSIFLMKKNENNLRTRE